MEKKNKISRRQFLSYSAMAGGIAALGASPLMMACSGDSKKGNKPLRKAGEYYVPDLMDKAIDGKPLKVGVIGCGGRGSGAIQNVLDAADGITVVALGDTFPDRVENLRKTLREKRNIEVPAENCFVGFDAYKKVIDAGADLVLLCTPTYYRPEHFKYATEKGVHSFLEKPVAVDPEGYRSVIATAKQAAAKNLCVVTGTQRHHERSYVEAYKRIQEGMIGEITGGNVYWNQNMLWYRNKERGWSDMEWMIRDWVNWTWLSGDHIVEQHVHNIDVFMWFSGLKPVKATGFGSRQRRITGNQYDFFSTDFEFENNVHLHSMCRQIDGCSNNIGEQVTGTKGFWAGSNGWGHIKDHDGNVLWEYDKEKTEAENGQNNPYVLEHINLINHIRRGEPINQAEETAMSTFAGIMGRESAYTGKTMTWEELSAASLHMIPDRPNELHDMDMSQFQIPVPGTSK